MVRRWVGCWVLVVAAEAGAGVLFPEKASDAVQEESTTPGAVVAELPAGRMPAAVAAEAFENGGQLIAKVVSRVEPVVRKSAPVGATNAQREVMRAEKWQAMKGLCDQLVGRAATFSVEVVDVVNRPRPAPPPAPLTGGATIEQVKKRDAAVRAYEERMRAWAGESMMVVGRVARVNAAPDSAEYRREVARITDEAERELRAANVEGVGRSADREGSRGVSYAARKKEIRDRLKADLAELKRQREAAVPAHTVYLVGGNAEFATWKRGQVRAVSGVIYRAGMDVHTAAAVGVDAGEGAPAASPLDAEDCAEACVSLELAVKGVPVSGQKPE